MALDKDEIKFLMQKVLNEYVRCGVIGTACDRAGVRRNVHKEWLERFPKYKELYEEIREKYVDGLEVVAHERAREKSDSLLMFLLKAERREKFGDRTELDHKNAQAPITLVFAEGMLNEDEKRLIEEAADAARGGNG